MDKDLSVEEGSRVILDDSPVASLAGSVRVLDINSMNDLVEHGIVSSADTLVQLLDVAKTVTNEALTNRNTFSPFVRVPRTSRPDLRRYGAFAAATFGVAPMEAAGFWRVARKIEPRALMNMDTNTSVRHAVGTAAALPTFLQYFFNDITVNTNGTLAIAASVQHVRCRDMLIKRGGRIEVHGGGVKISGVSIKGEN